MEETLEVDKRFNGQGNQFIPYPAQREMNIERKPHPYSIEVILGLKDCEDTTPKRTQSFRPYYRSKDVQSEQQCSTERNVYSRLVPRLGLVPQSHDFVETPGEKFRNFIPTLPGSDEKKERNLLGESEESYQGLKQHVNLTVLRGNVPDQKNGQHTMTCAEQGNVEMTAQCFNMCIYGSVLLRRLSRQICYIYHLPHTN